MIMTCLLCARSQEEYKGHGVENNYFQLSILNQNPGQVTSPVQGFLSFIQNFLNLQVPPPCHALLSIGNTNRHVLSGTSEAQFSLAIAK